MVGKLSNSLHGCAAKDTEEVEADGKADEIPRVKRGVEVRIGSGKQCSDQHGTERDEGQGENYNAYADAGRIHQASWSDVDEVRQDTSRLDRGGSSAITPTPKKDVIGPTYWKANRKHIWCQGGYCWSHV